ncbi:MAG: TonB-dependent receptor, partial [Pseudomonadota bacterium]|nr:TonB-dependent receptor [Pseudomonadota bacterium]
NDCCFPFFGIATIQPEHGRSVEVGATWQSAATSASATLYRNRVRNLIGFDPDPNQTDCPLGYFGCAANTSRARLQGATVAAGQRWGGLDVHATVDFLDARDADTGVRLARRAAHQETLTADYAIGAWSLGGSILDVGSRPDGGVVLGGYALVDL